MDDSGAIVSYVRQTCVVKGCHRRLFSFTKTNTIKGKHCSDESDLKIKSICSDTETIRVEEEGFCDFSLVMRKCHELRNVKFRTDCWGILHSIVVYSY